jgi:hypothetical protein
VKSTGPSKTLFRRAAVYLSAFEYAEAAVWDLDTQILAHIVSNLRNYYQQDADHTVKLVTRYFNPKSWEVWSPEAIRLAWDLVAPYTPMLGLSDEDAQSRSRMIELENDVVDLIAYTRPGGKVSVPALFEVYRKWHPDNHVDQRVFGKMVKSVTGIESKPRNAVRWYIGFHLPTEDELRDLAHSSCDEIPFDPNYAYPRKRRIAA